MFEEHTLNDIRTRLNIVDIIAEYVPLKKAGQSYVGICPFHKEKTPSFNVHPLRQCYHCFGCHKGGDLFAFIGEIEGLSFPLTVEKLAQRAGVDLPTRKKFQPKAPDPKELRLSEALDWARRYYHYLLMEKDQFRPVREYLKGRGLTERTVTKFQLGVAPSGWTHLLEAMQKRGFTFTELVQAGLVIEKQDRKEQGYDRFRQRLMFPILSAQGKVIGFGARLLEDDKNQPKYLNSPESPLFSKRRNLYGLFENTRAIRVRGEAIVVEGYMDVIGLWEKEVDNAVATMGTALTEEHCAQLRPLTNQVTTIFDPDTAGSDAWQRSVHIFLTAGILAKDVTLPEKLDPDEFVMKEGAEALYALCGKAPRQVTKLLKQIASRGSLSEQETSKVLEQLTPILVATRRSIERAVLWDDISRVSNTSLGALKELAETAASRLGGTAAPAQGAQRAGRPTPAKKLPRMDALDRSFFEAALHSPTAFQASTPAEWCEGVKDTQIREWLSTLHHTTAPERDTFLQAILQATPSPELGAVISGVLLAPSPEKENPNAFKELVTGLKRRKGELEVRALSAEIRIAQRLGNRDEEVKLLEKLVALRNALR